MYICFPQMHPTGMHLFYWEIIYLYIYLSIHLFRNTGNQAYPTIINK